MRAPTPTPDRAMLGQDLRLALVVTVLMLVGSGVALEDDFEVSLLGDGVMPQPPDAAEALVLLAGALPLTFRRIAPMPVFAVAALGSLGYQVLGYGAEPLPLAVLVALYTLVVMRRPVISAAAAVAYLLAVILAAVLGGTAITDDQFYIHIVAVVGTVMLGYGVALNRARASLAEQGAAELARRQEERTRAAVEREQARMAREIHDIVAHDLSVIVAQAAAARRVSAGQPQTAERALADIETVGRDALGGLRRLLGLLRTERAGGDQPQPGLDQLPELLTQVERAGMPVDLTIRGRPCPLPADVEFNAFRIIQEALTNSLTHAGPTRARVTLDYEEDALRVEVRDEGIRRPEEEDREPARSPGYGLTNMRQRAAMLGGELVAGPDGGRGYRVAARLPVPSAAR